MASPPNCCNPDCPSSTAFMADLSSRRAVGLLRMISRHLQTTNRCLTHIWVCDMGSVCNEQLHRVDSRSIDQRSFMWLSFVSVPPSTICLREKGRGAHYAALPLQPCISMTRHMTNPHQHTPQQRFRPAPPLPPSPPSPPSPLAPLYHNCEA